MERYFALIKNKLVEGIIVADNDFLNHIKDKYDYIIDVTVEERPHPGDSYYPETHKFISNTLKLNEIHVNDMGEHLTNGTEEEIEPFKISKHLVSYKDGIITIDCKQYPALGFLDSLHKVLVEKHNTTTIFTTSKSGPSHGKHGITWEDAELLYEKLKGLKVQ